MAAYNYNRAATGGAQQFNPLAAAAPGLAAKRAESRINSQLYLANGAKAPPARINISPTGAVSASPYQAPQRSMPVASPPNYSPPAPQAPLPVQPPVIAPQTPAAAPPMVQQSDADIRRQRALDHAAHVRNLQQQNGYVTPTPAFPAPATQNTPAAVNGLSTTPQGPMPPNVNDMARKMAITQGVLGQHARAGNTDSAIRTQRVLQHQRALAEMMRQFNG